MVTEMQKKMGGWLVELVAPALIMIMTGSLAFFLLDFGYDGPFFNRAKWVIGCFVFASVLISRISITEGMERAYFYGLILAVAVFAVLGFLTQIPILIRAVTIGIIWWFNSKLVWDCTHIRNTNDSSDRGLLSRFGWKSKSAEAQPEADKSQNQLLGTTDQDQSNDQKQQKSEAWTSRFFSRKKTANTPGVWVLILSVAALPFFGLGQTMMVNEATRQRSFFYFCCYLAAGLALLVTTAMMGLQRYLARRNANMPNTVAIGWVSTGAAMILIILVSAWLLPRPHSEVSFAENPFKVKGKSDLGSSRNSFGNEGKDDGRSGNQDNKSNNPSGKGKSDKKGGGRDGSKNKGGSGKGKQKSAGKSNSSKSNPSKQGNQSGKNKGQSKQGGKSNQGKKGNQSGSKSNDRSKNSEGAKKSDSNKSNGSKNDSSKNAGSQNENSKGKQNQSDYQSQNRNQSNEQKRMEERERQRSQRNKSNSGTPRSSQQNNRSNNGNSKSDDSDKQGKNSRSNQSSSKQNQSSFKMPTLPNIAWIFQLVFWIVVIAVALYFGWKYRQQVWEHIQKFIQDLKDFWARLFGKKTPSAEKAIATAGDRQPKVRPKAFREFSNPYQNGNANQLKMAEVVKYTYEALEAWGRERGLKVDPDQTPHEFVIELASLDRSIARSAKKLADFYCSIAFAQDQLDPKIVNNALEELWSHLEQVSNQVALQPA